MSQSAEQAMFLVRWWQEIIGGVALGAISLYFRSKGKSGNTLIVPISEDEIDHKMIICKQAVLLAIHQELDSRDEKLFAYVEKQDEKLLQRLTELMKARG